MQELDISNYVPPFVTETDELRWDDCTVCSTLMATASATLGETVSNRNWSTMSKAELKVLRERIRNHLGPGNQTGGTDIADMRKAFGIEYPWLPQIPSYEEQKNTWDEAKAKLLDGWGGIYMGNPNNVEDTGSKLRRWTISDNFGHAIWVDRARKAVDGSIEFYVMDPLGRGSYNGDWVPEIDLKQFTWTLTSNASLRYITLFKRGGWAKVSLKIYELNDTIDKLRKSLEDVTKARDAAILLRNAALVRADAAEAKVDQLNKTIATLQEKIQNKNAEIEKLKQRIQKLRN